MELLNSLAGFVVGLLVGVTGVGGGSLMSPILILIFGVAPVTAIGTDLWFAGVTKAIGGYVHHRQESADLSIVKWLAIGSIPAAVATILILSATGYGQVRNGVVVTALGGVLILTAFATLGRARLVAAMRRAQDRTPDGLIRWQRPMTAVAGAVLGVLVTLTSVGAGALGATILLLLYPFSLSNKRLVGTDIVHAVPLAITAGIGHLLIGNVDLELLGWLLLGSIPGIIVGARLTTYLPDRIVQRALAAILLFTGLKLLL